MKLTLERFAHHPVIGTFGILHVAGEQFYTVEQDWENNEPYKSCVPEGEYYLFPHDSPKYGKCYIIENESLNVAKYKTTDVKRFGCLIHPANKASQLQGCIAPGLDLGIIDGVLAVTSSRKALAQIQDLLDVRVAVPHTLHITSRFPTFTEE